MRDFCENERLIKEGLFSLQPFVVGELSDLVSTKLKAIKEFKEKEKKRDFKWLLDNLDEIASKIESLAHPIKRAIDLRRQLRAC